MFYLPNARMDRIHDQGEVFTLKGFADVINWLEFDRVEVLDVHSNVGAALLNRVYVFNPREYIDEVIEQISKENLILYFPDAGSSKRYSDCFLTFRIAMVRKIEIGIQEKFLDSKSEITILILKVKKF